MSKAFHLLLFLTEILFDQVWNSRWRTFQFRFGEDAFIGAQKKSWLQTTLSRPFPPESMNDDLVEEDKAEESDEAVEALEVVWCFA